MRQSFSFLRAKSTVPCSATAERISVIDTDSDDTQTLLCSDWRCCKYSPRPPTKCVCHAVTADSDTLTPVVLVPGCRSCTYVQYN